MHDSFWTHAADVPLLARLLREAFLELHSQPLLHQLQEQLEDSILQAEKRVTDEALTLPETPKLGSLDLNKVLEAEYFFN